MTARRVRERRPENERAFHAACKTCRQGGTYLVPAEGPGAGDEEGLRILGEEHVPRHADGISKDRNEVRGDVRHGRVRIGVEDLVSSQYDRAGGPVGAKTIPRR